MIFVWEDSLALAGYLWYRMLLKLAIRIILLCISAILSRVVTYVVLSPAYCVMTTHPMLLISTILLLSIIVMAFAYPSVASAYVEHLDEGLKIRAKTRRVVEDGLTWYTRKIVERTLERNPIMTMNAQESSEGVVDAVTKCITRLHRITQSRHVRSLWSRVGLSLNALDNMPELVLRPHKERIKDHFETVNTKFLLDWMNGDVTDRESSHCFISMRAGHSRLSLWQEFQN